MLISERKNYLRNNPKLPAFASEIQIKVLTQLAIPTMENVSECLRVLKHGTLDEAKNMCYKINVNLLAHIKNKDWHYSVYVELMDRITDRMLELYKALIPTLTLDEMKERMARLRVEKQDAVYDLYPSSEYENALDLCLLLCRTSLNERTYKISAKQEASNDLEYTLRNLQKHNKKS